MKKIHVFSFILLLLRIYYIKNDDNSTQKIYFIKDLSNFKCFTSNYTTTFSAITNSKTPIESNINFVFTIKDLEKTSHSAKCTILGENTLRRMNGYEEDTTENDSEENIGETDSNDDEKSFESMESEESSTLMTSTTLPITPTSIIKTTVLLFQKVHLSC